MKWLALLLFGSVGLTLFIWGIVWGVQRLRLMLGGVRTNGSVVELFEAPGASYPVVEFAASDGKTYRFRGSTGSNTPDYQVGAGVGLVYRSDNPSDAQIVDFAKFWLGPVGVRLIGFVFLVAGFISFNLFSSADDIFGPAFKERVARNPEPPRQRE